MRVALHADPQFCERSIPGLLAQRGTLSFIAHEMRARGVSLGLSGGDTWERPRCSPQEMEAAEEYAIEHANVCSFAAVYGNHDDETNFASLERLAARHRIVAATAPRVELLGGAAVAFLPYPRLASLAAWRAARGLPATAKSEDAGHSARQMFADVLRGLGTELDAVAPIGSGIPRILLGHGMTDGGRSSTGQPIIGEELRVGLIELGLARCHLYCFGHLHNGPANEFTVTWPDGTAAPGLHAGSTRRRDYGELEPKRFVVFTFDGDRLVGREDVPLPVPPMIHLERLWTADGWATADLMDLNEANGALIRLRYAVASDRRDAARLAAATDRSLLLAAGAAEVRVEDVVIPTTRSRAPEIAAAQGVRAKLPLLWAARGDVPSPERAARLLDTAEQVEREIAA